MSDHKDVKILLPEYTGDIKPVACALCTADTLPLNQAWPWTLSNMPKAYTDFLFAIDKPDGTLCMDCQTFIHNNLHFYDRSRKFLYEFEPFTVCLPAVLDPGVVVTWSYYQEPCPEESPESK